MVSRRAKPFANVPRHRKSALPDKLNRQAIYPVAPADKGDLPPTVHARWSGDKRPPRRGEWYLSGSTIQAYCAAGDLEPAYPIAELVLVATPIGKPR